MPAGNVCSLQSHFEGHSGHKPIPASGKHPKRTVILHKMGFALSHPALGQALSTNSEQILPGKVLWKFSDLPSARKPL
jgi:hypothetical protein